MGSGDDNVTVHPHDAGGNLMINGNLGIGGGGGTDTMTIDDTASSLSIAYRFYNQFGPGTTNIGTFGTAGFGAGSDFEHIVINAGGGDDTFTIEQFRSTTTSLEINAGGGDDRLDVCPVSKTLPANLVNGNFFYNAGEGFDSFRIYNDNNTSGWGYDRESNGLFIYLFGSGANFYDFFLDSVEYCLSSGSGGDNFVEIKSTPANSLTQFIGKNNDDDYYIGSNSHTTANILGSISIDGNNASPPAGLTNLNNIYIDNTIETAPRTFHVYPNTVGAVPGDNLFGPGASLFFQNINGTIRVQNGSGADTAYVTPNQFALVRVEMNNPTTPQSGDTLGLAMVDAVNPVLTPNGTGAGTYSFTNRKQVQYTGVEGVFTDNVRPSVIAHAFNYNAAVQSITYQFSEDVSGSLDPTYLVIGDLGTGEQIPYENIALAYNHATNTATFTFPGYAHGILPDANYTAQLSGQVPDLFGNTMGTDFNFDFFFMTGDANHDARVNLVDFNILAANFNHSPRTFVQGDFNYDQTVNLLDFNLLASRFNTALPAATGFSNMLIPSGSGSGMTRVIDSLRNDLLA